MQVALVTGAAGFIGFHLSRKLLEAGYEVVGFDGMTPYYDPSLKHDRIAILNASPRFRLVHGMLEDAEALTALVAETKPDVVVHLAAQAGVRYSIEAPQSYIQSNVVGTANLLEAIRAHPVRHLMFASTSSVYGGTLTMPFSEVDPTSYPLSLYAATKRAGEAMVHSYAHLWQQPSTCFRFFTVYGPYGRPDMAPIKFASAIMAGRPIDVYGNGAMKRDFTYVGDLVDRIVGLIDVVPGADTRVEGDSLSPVAPFRVVNLGGGQTTELLDFIATLERALGKKAIMNMMPMQPGDVVNTQASTDLMEKLIGETSITPLEIGLQHFAEWFKNYSEPA